MRWTDPTGRVIAYDDEFRKRVKNDAIQPKHNPSLGKQVHTMVFKRLLAVSALVVASITTSSFAGSATVFHPGLRRTLTNAPADGTFTLRNVDLGRESLDTIELERMEVWAKDAKVVVFGPDGEQSTIAPPDVKYFKGRVVGADESAIFFSKSADGTIRGMVLIGERRWNVGTGVRLRTGDPRSPRTDSVRDDEAPVLISESDVIDDYEEASREWECQALLAGPHSPRFIAKTEGKSLTPVANAGNVSGATYQLRLAFETDGEFCTAFGDNTTTLTTYIGDLVGKATTVYSRDLSTTLVIGATNLRTGGGAADPWTVTAGSGRSAALAEFGTFWHNNFSMASVPRSSAVFLSGKIFNGGIAWFDFLCGDDFFCGADGSQCGSATFANKYAGAYAFNGSSGSVTTTVPDPTATVNGVPFGLPTTGNFWMLLETLHELGHNVGGPHTQCMALTAPERVLYGVTRDFVDECYNLDGGGCFSGSMSGGQACAGGYCPGGVPVEKGSVMSYCHNIFVSGSRQSRYLFGKAGEASEKVLTVFNTALEAATPNPTIMAETQPVACSAGRTASVATCSGCTYSWQITGGSITSSTTISAITYTPTQSSVTLTVTVITARGCGITASKVISTSCVAVLAPTNVTATATSTSSVNVTWTASVGAASYNVYRSTDNTTFALAGNTASTAFTDAGRTASTAYMYKVRAVNGGESADSNKDLATTVIFTDDPLVIGTTVVKAAHITELRTAVNAVRALTPLGAGTYTDPALSIGTTLVKAAHINDLRTALDAARSNLALSAISYGETVTGSTTTIKASHFTELRNGVK